MNEGVKEVPPAMPGESLRDGIAALFGADDAVIGAVTTNLARRTAVSQDVSDRARSAFRDFTASRYPSATREGTSYLTPGNDLQEAMKYGAMRTVDQLREAPPPAGLLLQMTDSLKELLFADDDDDKPGMVDLGALVDLVIATPEDAYGHGSGTATVCSAETEADLLLVGIEQPRQQQHEAYGANHDAADNSNIDDHELASSFVNSKVSVQTEFTTAPEGELRFAVPHRADQQTSNNTIQTFELRDGPSDVTAYHDFTSIEIAFPHVWTEIFDGRLRTLGEELYQEYVKLKIFADVDDVDRPVGTLEDLKRLMAEVEELSRTVESDLPPDLRSADTGPPATGAPGASTLMEVARTALDPASILTDGIKNDTVRAFLNPGGYVIDALTTLFAGKQQLSWASFPGPLPVGGDVITVTVEEGVMEPGVVEIVLLNSPEASWWKGIHFRELDLSNSVVTEFKISNDRTDTDVWDRAAYNRLPLYTPQVQRAVLEFSKAAILGVHSGFYLLGNLGEKLKDRNRVTFTWMQD